MKHQTEDGIDEKGWERAMSKPAKRKAPRKPYHQWPGEYFLDADRRWWLFNPQRGWIALEWSPTSALGRWVTAHCMVTMVRGLRALASAVRA